MNIVLFNPRAKGFREQDEIIGPPLALLAIAGPLLEDSHSVDIIDANVEPYYKDKLTQLLPRAGCFGITAMTGYPIFNAIEAAKIARRINPSLPIVWGGYHPSILPEQTARSEYVDFVVRGQGEATFRELINALDLKKDPDSVAGLTFLAERGGIVNTPRRPFEDINHFPPMPWRLIDVEKYINKDAGARTLGYRTSQGCPHNCSFCAEPIVVHRRWSGLSSERIVSELKFLYDEYRIDAVSLHDSNFFADKERARSIFHKIEEEGLDIKFAGVPGRAEQIRKYDDELLRLLEKRCKNIFIGAESGSDDILRFINKRFTVNDTIEAKKVLSKYNITPCIALMLGFPRDGTFTMSLKEELFKLLDLVDTVRRIDNNNSIGIMLYTPYPGTPLFEAAIKNGIRRPSKLEDWYDYIFSFSQVSWIPKKYELLTEELNKYIFPYTSSNFMAQWSRLYVGRHKRIKKMLHQFLGLLAGLRLKFRFFGFPLEYMLIMNFSNRRFKGRRRALQI